MVQCSHISTLAGAELARHRNAGAREGGLLEPVEVPSSCSSLPEVSSVVLLGLDWMIWRLPCNLGDSVIPPSPTPSL